MDWLLLLTVAQPTMSDQFRELEALTPAGEN